MARTEEFSNGLDAARGVQTRPYKPTSVLDNIMPTGLGFSAGDKERLLPGGRSLQSFNGASEGTREKQVWLTEPRATIGA
jgi:hypothetical protein